MNRSRYSFLFDYDGVLIYKINFIRHAVINHGVNEKALGKFFKKYLQSCLRGEEDMIELLDKHRQELNWAGTATELFDAIYDHDGLFQVDLFEWIADNLMFNYDCYVATNQDWHRFEAIKKEGEIRRYFKDVFCSCKLGVAKPEVAYFEKIINLLQKEHADLRPEQLIFTDDIPENVESAESLGIHAHLFQDARSFFRFAKRVIQGRVFPQIESPDLSLINMKFSHATGYSDILSEPSTFQFLTESGPQNREKALDKIITNRHGFDIGKSIYWSMIDKAGNFLGYLAIHQSHTPKVSISYGVHPAFRRQGLASKALEMVLDHEMLRGKTIEMATHLDNDASFEMLSKMNVPYQGISHTRFGERHVFRVERK